MPETITDDQPRTARIIIAPDSFKGTLDADDVAEAIAEGWRSVRPDDAVLEIPQADGGEGTLAAIERAVPGSRRRSAGWVTGPHGAPVAGAWLELPDGTAVVELALSSGLALMNPLDAIGATTRGLGEVIAAAIDARAKAYTAQLAALDTSVRARLAAVPPAQRRIVTSHDAFGYMADAWSLDMRAAQGWTTAGEASAADVARLIRQLRAQRVRALFVENISDPRLVQRIAHEAGATLGGTLYSDALSPPGGRADSYLKLMRHNVTQLVQGMQQN